MRRYFRLAAACTVLLGCWLVYWEPVEYITNNIGPLLSTVLGIIIIAVGAVFWKIKAV